MEILIFLLASIIHGIVGFAFALVATPLLSLILPVKSAVLMTIIPTIFINMLSSFKVTEKIIREYFIFFILIAAGSVSGTFFLFIINQKIFMFFLVLIIWLFLYLDYNKVTFGNIQKFKNIIAFLSGVSAGITNVMSPILLIYFLSVRKSKEEIIIITNISFFIAKIVQFVLFLKFTQFPENYLGVTVIILFVEIIGFFIGKKIGEKKIIKGNYRFLVKSFVFLISLILTAKIIT